MSLVTFGLLFLNITYKGSHLNTMIIISANGFFNIGSYSVLFEYAVDITPTVGEGMTQGVINLFGNMLGFAMIMLI